MFPNWEQIEERQRMDTEGLSRAQESAEALELKSATAAATTKQLP
jgi:hypothetical protein